MKKILIFALILLLTIPFSACPKKTSGSEKISDIVAAARSIATIYVAIGVLDRIVEIVQNENSDSAQAIYKISERALRLLDRARATINSGIWDTKELDQLLDDALAEVANLEQELGFKNPTSAARFREYIALARFAITSAASIVKKLQPPAAPATPTIESDSARNPNAQSLTVTQTAEILEASTLAAKKIIEIRSANAEIAWKMAEDESEEIHAANAQRIK